MQHVMIDLETLDTKPSAQILSVGMVPFDPYTGLVDESSGVHIAVERTAQEAAGRTASQSTLAWWDRQSPEARAAWDVEEHDLFEPVDMLRELARMFHTRTYVWSHGSIFDVAILEHLLQSLRIPPPWKYHDIRDTRTIFDVAGVKVNREDGTHHNALDDAIAQAHAVCEAYKVLGKTNEKA